MADVTNGHQPYMTIKECAAYLRISVRTVRRMVHAGKLPGDMVAGKYRFYKTDVDTCVRDGRTA